MMLLLLFSLVLVFTLSPIAVDVFLARRNATADSRDIAATPAPLTTRYARPPKPHPHEEQASHLAA